MYEYIDFSDLLGKTLTHINVNNDDDKVTFNCSDGTIYLMHHSQDCCESVSLENIDGDLESLIGEPILLAEKITNSDFPKSNHDEDFQWTFYKLATNKGFATLRWYGESNGYYSTDVSFLVVEKPKMTLTIQQKQQRVLDYINDKDQSPLVFEDRKVSLMELESVSLSDVIIWVLKNTQHSSSIHAFARVEETISGKWRSSLDIWRHVKAIQPEVTIFEVMEALHSLPVSKIGCHFCNDIRRRVFRPQNKSYSLMARPDMDEYGLYWEDWETMIER